jgi:hypothetical protein
MASSILGTVGGIIGNNQAAGQQAAAGQDIQTALQNYQNINVPTIAEQQWNLAQEQAAGTLSPQAATAAQMGPNALANITTNPAYTTAQQQQLAALQQLGQGGMTAQERQNLIQSQQAAAGNAQAQNAAILQGMAARGVGGSGAQLAAQLSASQNAANQGASNANATNAMAQQNALGAMTGAGGLASQLQQTQFGQQAAVAQAQNAINQFNTMNQQNTGMYNTQAQNQAQAQNLANAQNISNTNVGLQNQAQQHNTGLYQQQYGNQMQQAGAEAGVLGAQSQYNQNQANATRGEWSGIGSAVGSGIDAGASYLSGSGGGSGDDSQQSMQMENQNFDSQVANTPDGGTVNLMAKGGMVKSRGENVTWGNYMPGPQGGYVNRFADGGMALPASQAATVNPQTMQQAQQMAALAQGTNGVLSPNQPSAMQSLSPQQLAAIQAMLATKPQTPQGSMTMGLPGGSVAPNQNSPVVGGMAHGGRVPAARELSPQDAEKLGHFMSKFAQGGMINPPDYNKGGEVSTLGMNSYANGGSVAPDDTPAELKPYWPTPQEEQDSGLPPGPQRAGYIANRKRQAANMNTASPSVGTNLGGSNASLQPTYADGGLVNHAASLAPLVMMALAKGGKVPEHNNANLDVLQKSFGKFISEEKREPKKMYEGGNLTGLPHSPPAKKADSTDAEQSYAKGGSVDEALQHPDTLHAGAKARAHLSPKNDAAAIMKEFARGTLRSGSGEHVKDPQQAKAIAMSESGQSKYADGGQVDDSGNLPLSTRQQIMQSLANTFAPKTPVAPKQYAVGAHPNAEDAASYGEAETMSPSDQAELAKTQAALAKFNAARGLAHGGSPSNLNVGMEMVKGGHVPGKAKVKGDSPKNDIVDAKLSPGEIVIPRSKVNGSDDDILNFVKKVREGRK